MPGHSAMPESFLELDQPGEHLLPTQGGAWVPGEAEGLQALKAVSGGEPLLPVPPLFGHPKAEL